MITDVRICLDHGENRTKKKRRGGLRSSGSGGSVCGEEIMIIANSNLSRELTVCCVLYTVNRVVMSTSHGLHVFGCIEGSRIQSSGLTCELILCVAYTLLDISLYVNGLIAPLIFARASQQACLGS